MATYNQLKEPNPLQKDLSKKSVIVLLVMSLIYFGAFYGTQYQDMAVSLRTGYLVFFVANFLFGLVSMIVAFLKKVLPVYSYISSFLCIYVSDTILVYQIVFVDDAMSATNWYLFLILQLILGLLFLAMFMVRLYRKRYKQRHWAEYISGTTAMTFYLGFKALGNLDESIKPMMLLVLLFIWNAGIIYYLLYICFVSFVFPKSDDYARVK